MVVEPDEPYEGHMWTWKAKIIQFFIHEFYGDRRVFFQGKYYNTATSASSSSMGVQHLYWHGCFTTTSMAVVKSVSTPTFTTDFQVEEESKRKAIAVATLLWPSVGVKPNTWKKVRIWSPPGISNFQSSIARGRTPRIGVFFVSLERS